MSKTQHQLLTCFRYLVSFDNAGTKFQAVRGLYVRDFETSQERQSNAQVLIGAIALKLKITASRQRANRSFAHAGLKPSL